MGRGAAPLQTSAPVVEHFIINDLDKHTWKHKFAISDSMIRSIITRLSSL